MKTKFILVLFLVMGSFVDVNSGCLITTSCGEKLNTMGPGYFSNCYSEYMRYLEELNYYSCGTWGPVQYDCFEEIIFDFKC